MEIIILAPDSATLKQADIFWRYWSDMKYKPPLIQEAVALNPVFPVLALAHLLTFENLPNPYSSKYPYNKNNLRPVV